MIAGSMLMVQRRIAASPIWLRLEDTFTGRAPAGPLEVTLERRSDQDWVAFEHQHTFGRRGDLIFVGLGRTHDPAAVGSFDVRVTATAPRTIPEAEDGEPTITKTVTAWAPHAPGPAAPQLPDTLHFYPGPAYRFPNGTPLLAGRVLDPDGIPVARARIWATATIQNTLLTEEVRSDGDGRFRLPLRWSVGATDVNATHGAQAGSITVVLPADLSSTHQITLT